MHAEVVRSPGSPLLIRLNGTVDAKSISERMTNSEPARLLSEIFSKVLERCKNQFSLNDWPDPRPY